MKHAWLMLLVMIPSCCQETCRAQSIVVSGGQRSIVVSGKQPVQAVPVVEEKTTSPVVSDDTHHEPVHRTAGEVRKTKVVERYLVSEPWCGYCKPARAAFLASGGKLENIINTETAKALGEHWDGYGVPHEFVLERIVETRVDQPLQSTGRDVSDQPSNYTEAQRQADINHLLTHRAHAGKFTREYLETLSGYQLIDLHNTDHGVPTRKGQKIGVSVAPAVSQPNRYIQWPGWGTIDLETYNRNCNCAMCRSIRQKQAEYWRQKAQTAVSPDQEGCPYDVVEAMLDQMQLRPGDVLGDLGCGDGRILVAAARRGIRGIGIELDPVRSEIARQNVAAAGVSHLVTIETGDALEFDTGRITAATAYLYPPLLEKLSPRLSGLRVVASPFHEIPGLQMTQAGDVWIARKG